MKIDILEAYVWISEVFRVKSEFYRSTERLPEPPGDLMGLSGPWWKERRGGQGMGRAPSPLVRIGQGEGGGAPLPSSPPLFPYTTLFRSGILCLDIGSVPGKNGILPEYREVTGTPPGGIWALVGFSGREER